MTWASSFRNWLRERTVFQRIALGLLIISCAIVAISFAFGEENATTLPLFALLLMFFAFRRDIFWRVRNRLLVNYFLLGVVPLVLIGALVILTAQLMLAAFASERVRQDLDARIATVQGAAQDLALATSRGGQPDLLEYIRRRVPRMEAVVRQGAIPRLQTGSFASAPDWLAPEFRGVFETDGNYFIGASAREPGAEAFAYIPLDAETRAALTPGLVEVAALVPGEDDTNVNGNRVTVDRDGVRREVTAQRLSAPKGRWDVSVASMLIWPAQVPSGKRSNIVFVLFTRPSAIMAGAGAGSVTLVLIAIMAGVAAFFVFVELVALVMSIGHTRAITRSVHDLYTGTKRIGKGDFSYQIPIRGKDQLGELAASFNSMTKQIVRLLGEERKKEHLESELEIARQVQNNLFPRAVPQLKTLELAGTCIPGRFISGDYYDFVPLDARWTAIALGDVSGKGVSAALVMASIQSSLHAQLKFRGGAGSPTLSMALLMGLISQQLYESTPAEKYATFFCSVYDDETGVLRYTNAGHLKPILIREGKADTLPGDGIVVGLLPHSSYEQQEFQLKPGDLVAIFSDGIPEAENDRAQEFGEDRLAALLTANAEKPLDEIIRIVTTSVTEWATDPDARDDTTIVLARRRLSV